MSASKSRKILEARMAYDAGDNRRGSQILHKIFKADISYMPAWELLYSALQREDAFQDFQRYFISKYYPDKLAQFNQDLEEAKKFEAGSGPYRRVTLFTSRSSGTGRERKAAAGQDGKESERSSLERGDIPEEEGDLKDSPADEPSSGMDRAGASGADRGGLLGKLRAFIGRLARGRNREAGDQDASDADGEAAGAAEGPEAQITPLSLKELPDKKASEADTVPEEKRDGIFQPLLSKLQEEQLQIRLIIADDISQTRENIRKLLTFEPAVDVVAVASHGEEAVDKALKLVPDIVLMDINMPGMDGLQALKTIREKLPATQVIMLTVQDDPGYLREALQFGARDYLIKPPTIDELLHTISKVHEIGKMEQERIGRLHSRDDKEEQEELEGDVDGMAIAVFSPKGGVGSTFLASNLAVEAQANDRSVILVDCDLHYGGVGLFFNEHARSSIVDLAPSVKNLDLNLYKDAVVRHQKSGVSLILAPQRPEQAEQVSGGQIVDLIEFLRRRFAVVAVDTGSSLDDRLAEVLPVCDEVIVPMTQDIPAINEVRQLLDYAPHVGLEVSKITLVLNQYHRRINISPEQINRHLRREISAVIPLDSRTAIPSINRGVPFMADPEGRARPIGKAVSALVQQVLERELMAA